MPSRVLAHCVHTLTYIHTHIFIYFLLEDRSWREKVVDCLGGYSSREYNFLRVCERKNCEARFAYRIQRFSMFPEFKKICKPEMRERDEFLRLYSIN